jgi:hypothetical protein
MPEPHFDARGPSAQPAILALSGFAFASAQPSHPNVLFMLADNVG